MGTDKDFQSYLEYLCEDLGHAKRQKALAECCSALMIPIERKSIEPLAATVDPHMYVLRINRCIILLLKRIGLIS